MEKQQTTAKGFAILSASGLVTKILSLIYVPIQAAIVHDYGNNVISYGFRLYVFMFALSNAGLPSTISKMIAHENTLGNYKGSQRIFRVATGMLLVLGITCSVMLAAGAKWISVAFGQSETYMMLLTLSPAFLFTAVNCALRGYFQGTRNMIPTAVSSIVEQFFNSLFTVIFVYLFFTYSSESQKYSNAAVGSALGTIIGAASASVFLIFIYYVTRQQRDSLVRRSQYCGPQRTSGQIVRELLKYVIPAIIGAVSSSAADLIDSLNCVLRMTAGGLSENLAKDINGQYTTQYQRLISLITIVATALMTAVVPAISKACSLKDRKMIKHTVNRSFKALFIFMIPCLVAFTIFAKPIIMLVFFRADACGSQELHLVHAGSDQFLATWGWSNVFWGMYMLQTGILIAISKPLAGPVNLIIGMIAKLILNIILLPVINMNGAAVGSLVGWVITVILNEHAMRKVMGKTPYGRLLMRPLVFSLIMGVSYFPFLLMEKLFGGVFHSELLVSDLSMLVTIFIAVYIYAFLIVRSKTLGKAEILRLPMGGKIVLLCRKFRMFPKEDAV